MKITKKITTYFLAFCIVFSLAACGDEEELTAVLRRETVSNGIPVTDTITITAIGDKTQTQLETVFFDLTDFDLTDEEQEQLFDGIIELMENTYKGIDAIAIKDIDITTTTLAITITFDFTGDLKGLQEIGIVDAGSTNGELDHVSFTKSKQNLETQGYREVTE